MAADYFLKLGDIDGESTDKDHLKWIPVDSFQWGVSEPVSVGSGGRPAGTPAAADLTLTVPISSATPDMFIDCAMGKVLDPVYVTCRKAGSSADFMKIELNDVLITSYQTGGTEETPYDQVTLNFAKYTISYTPTNVDGSLGQAIVRSYDFLSFVKI